MRDTGNTGRTARRHAAIALVLALGAVALGGCFDAPKLEDRWTRIDLPGSNVTPGQTFAPGTAESIRVSTTITYRAIVTGYLVAELRASTLAPGDVAVRPDAPRLRMAQDIDRILASSVSRGRAIRAVTGWDHLIQPIDLAFTGAVPGAADTLGTATRGGLFLLCYLGAGQRIELPSGQDTIVVTPFSSEAAQLLPIGMPLGVAAAGPR